MGITAYTADTPAPPTRAPRAARRPRSASGRRGGRAACSAPRSRRRRALRRGRPCTRRAPPTSARGRWRGGRSARRSSDEPEHFLRATLRGNLAVPFLDLDADGPATEGFGGDEGGAGAHEGIEDGAISEGDAPAHERNRLLCRVLPTHPVVVVAVVEHPHLPVRKQTGRATCAVPRP